MDKEITIDFQIAKLGLKPGDVVIVKVPAETSFEGIQRLSGGFDAKHIDTLIVAGEFEMSVLRRSRNLSLRAAIREIGALKERIAKLEKDWGVTA